VNTRKRVTAIPAFAFAGIATGFPGNLLRVASQATPIATDGDYPTIDLVVDENGVTGMPEALAADRYRVNISSETAAIEDGIGVLFSILPEGLTPEQAFEDIQSADPYPEWFHDAHFGGGVNLLYDSLENWGVIDFTAGNWIVTSLGARTLGVPFRVTGDLSADPVEPESSVTFELDEMTITITEGKLVAADNLVHVTNVGEQIHHLSFVKVPDGTVREQVQALWDSFLSGTPEAGALDEAATREIAYFAELSPGVSQWGPLSLEAGTYVLTCFVGDPTMGNMPHAFMGMWDILTID
jgi:hypothetical protein